jgi:hypothetical protein
MNLQHTNLRNQMMLRSFILTVSLLALNLGFISSKTAQAQYRDCGLIRRTNEPPSSSLRTIRLEQFGIQVSIPENFRTILRQNNTVEIVHPDDFAMIECVAQGGRGGHGYYSEMIRLVSQDPSLSLREQAIWSVGYGYDINQNKIPIATQVIEYNQLPLSGYIVTSRTGSSVNFVGNVTGRTEILYIDASCDCLVEVKNLTTLLSRIQPLNWRSP